MASMFKFNYYDLRFFNNLVRKYYNTTFFSLLTTLVLFFRNWLEMSVSHCGVFLIPAYFFVNKYLQKIGSIYLFIFPLFYKVYAHYIHLLHLSPKTLHTFTKHI